ncbi:MAG: site-specific integrase [Chloroflexota bacterium]
MSRVYRRGNRLWLDYQGQDGKRHRRPTPFAVGQEQQARELLREVEAQIQARLAPQAGAKTLTWYARRWYVQRREQGVDWKNDRSRMEIHILPALGHRALDDIRPMDLAELFLALRKMRAPRTVRSVYGALCALYRDAVLEDLIAASPCVLTSRQLGAVEDADPEWRGQAQYSRAELELLISSELLPVDRRVMWAIMGLAGLRHGEVAGLRWRHYAPEEQPLGRLTVATSYNKRRTKTGRTRQVPVHPALAVRLLEWKRAGWLEAHGRFPEPDDLVLPVAPDSRLPAGSLRRAHGSWEFLQKDLEALGLRRRRTHDLRRTMITLARSDGARSDVLKAITHGAAGGVMELYTTWPWAVLCDEMTKLQIGGDLMSSKQVDNGVLAQVQAQKPDSPMTSSTSKRPQRDLKEASVGALEGCLSGFKGGLSGNSDGPLTAVEPCSEGGSCADCALIQLCLLSTELLDKGENRKALEVLRLGLKGKGVKGVC